jgi:multiple sugar transport system ATP-binding protein
MVEAVGSDSFVYFRNPSRLGYLNVELEDLGVPDEQPSNGALHSVAVARVSPFAAVAAGDRAKLWIAPERIHLFDVVTGISLTTAAA